MPKERRRRSGAHNQSVRLPSQREIAVRDDAVEHITIGEHHDPSAAEILADMAEDEEPRPTLKKKAKQALKHQMFMERLEQTQSPYSKSHERRLKRRAREQVAGGMHEIKAAICSLEDEMPEAIQNSVPADDDAGADAASRPQKARPKPGQIGKGKGAPLSKNQRKRVLQVERMRIPMILATPEFAANPFQAVRTHAQNSLLKHEPPTATSTFS